MSSPLTVYRASAGAGKTFRLVVEYIKLLMLSPDEYKHILAVTFTKKATAEMKIRILSQLYGLREGLSSSNDYLERISAEMPEISKEDIRKNAGIALGMILKDYGHFRIETIDSFFQSVLRNMTRELDISSNMHVELNGDQVKDNAIDALIDRLEPSDHLFKRVVRFAEENMDEGHTWDVIKGLKAFGSNIFSNFYQSHAKEFKSKTEDKRIFQIYKDNLNSIIKSAEKEILDAADGLRKQIEAQGITDIGIFKYSNKSGLGLMYKYLEEGKLFDIPANVKKYSQDENAWLKSDDKKKYQTAVSTVLMPALNVYLELQAKNASAILTCQVIKRNLNNIELLGDIEDAVNESNVNANRFLLSSTNQLLSDMIGDSDAPFIYEKIGTQVKHLLIDEFQDTSTLQWSNFKRLLEETMSSYDAKKARGTIGSMIVGDVKQSIYRWRDGDWKLLHNIKDEFADPDATQIRDLDTNFRSEANIINFNNAFFLRLKDICGIESAYDDVAQKVKPGRIPKGEIEFIMMSESSYKLRHKMICDKVNDLIKSGVKAKDIAILGRNGNILKELSKSFMDYYPEIKVVSIESFILNTSKAVNTIVCALRLLLKPTDRILLATLAKDSEMSEEECSEALKDINATNPLLDVVEEIFIRFNVERMTEESAFVSAFFDNLKDFASKNTSTIRNFLKAWDEKISSKAIETESVDGVKMMTVHKSKGLEFDNVIVADGSWPTKLERNTIWVELKEPPLSAVPITIIQASKSLEKTIFARDYKEECEQFVVDNMNLLYVAFTRAGKNLYYYGQTSKKYNEIVTGQTPEKYNTQHMGGKVECCLDTMSVDMDMTSESFQDETDEKRFYYIRHYGEFAVKEDKKKEKSKNVFDMEVTPVNISLHLDKPSVTFVQSNRSKEFVDNAKFRKLSNPETLETSETIEASGTSKTNSYISVGLLLHYVLSQIESVDDVDIVLKKLEMEGVISNSSYSSLIKKRIHGNEYAKHWFAPGWTVYNECPILTSKKTKRPDRVVTNGKETIVIDFKFGKEDSEYNKQVERYMELLEQIGLPNVKGYIWYVYDDKVQEVVL